ncbi:MAG TPA: hypothetical protein PK765_05335 [bacterium]|nr:hypothetical protein [bacterium]
MAPDSLRFFENAPDAPKKDADVSPKVDLSEFERRYRSLKDMAARGELKDTLGTILATRDAGQCLRTGQWYVESVRDGVWLSPIGTESLGASRPKTFVSYFELEHSIDDLLTSLAVPSNGLDAFKEKKPELSEAEKQSVRRELTYLDRQIDLAGSRGENTLQSALIDFRVGFAESEALWAPTSTAEALRTANADLARVLAPDYRAGAKDYWDLSVDFINLLRYGTSQASAEMFARIKDNTSRKLFEL